MFNRETEGALNKALIKALTDDEHRVRVLGDH